MFIQFDFAADGGTDWSSPSARLAPPSTFAEALRTAIDARGLTLERIRDHLLLRGVSVSPATLSYWQSGRSHPERRSSLVVVDHLEDVLRLAPGTLTLLLGEPRRRGRWLKSAGRRARIDALWPNPKHIEDALGQVDTRWDGQLTRISLHDRTMIGPDRGERSTTSRQVLRAEADGVDRWVVIAHIDDHDQPLPVIRPLRHCRLGRVVPKQESGLLIAELLFDTPLHQGETIITEHELVASPPFPAATNYERKFRLPVREYVQEVCFETKPERCEQFSRTEAGVEQVRQVRLDDRDSVHAVALDFGPGCFGFRWDWGPESR